LKTGNEHDKKRSHCNVIIFYAMQQQHLMKKEVTAAAAIKR
jgi:hypothetical protein